VLTYAPALAAQQLGDCHYQEVGMLPPAVFNELMLPGQTLHSPLLQTHSPGMLLSNLSHTVTDTPYICVLPLVVGTRWMKGCLQRRQQGRSNMLEKSWSLGL
jgi:hypothetical protein